jgi:hypothetical protein
VRCFPSPLNPPISNFIVLVEWLDDLPEEDTAADMTADIDDFLVVVIVVVVATEPLRLRDDACSVRFSVDAVARAVVNDNEGLRGREYGKVF